MRTYNLEGRLHDGLEYYGFRAVIELVARDVPSRDRVKPSEHRYIAKGGTCTSLNCTAVPPRSYVAALGYDEITLHSKRRFLPGCWRQYRLASRRLLVHIAYT
jgi:hypothetical protein